LPVTVGLPSAGGAEMLLKNQSCRFAGPSGKDFAEVVILTESLVIFDYSGTLNLEMAVFARPDSLLRHLKTSGLFALGLKNNALFWKIINSTWQEGSTTGVGYKKIMLANLQRLFPDQAQPGKPQLVKAVADFAEAYFSKAEIDARWRPLLKMLSGNNVVQVVIATDHYAEATGAISKHLKTWHIHASGLPAVRKGEIFIANSADIGFHKESYPFWETVKNILKEKYARVILIDDFGTNEQQADAYAQEYLIDSRRRKTLDLLERVFAAPVKCFSFAAQDQAIAELILQTTGSITRLLAGEKSTK